MNARQLRTTPESEIDQLTNRRPFYIIGDSLYDTFNISGLFRLSDALCARELILCGVSEVPPNPKIIKYTVGTHKIVPWRKFSSVEEALGMLHSEVKGLTVVALEQTEKSVSYQELPKIKGPVAIIAGNESNGVSKKALDLSHHHVSIPMFGLNNSLNVVVATSIVGYHFALSNSG